MYDTITPKPAEGTDQHSKISLTPSAELFNFKKIISHSFHFANA